MAVDIWAVTGAISSVIAIVVAVVIYMWQRQRKRLFVNLNARIPLLTRRFAGIPGLSIHFDNRPLQNVTALLVRIANGGSAPIVVSDFHTDLILEFNHESTLLSADLLDAIPEEISVNILIDQNRLILSPHLLNPKDYYELRILVDGEYTDFKATTRIAGVEKIEKRNLFFFGNIAMPLGCVMLAVFSTNGPIYGLNIDKLSWGDIPYVAGMAASVLIGAYGLRHEWKNYRDSSSRPR